VLLSMLLEQEKWIVELEQACATDEDQGSRPG
jgi:hypothetical protein